MGKRILSKRPKAQQKPQSDKATVKPQTNSDEPSPFDFGGLPNVNLKKNLGCG
jgi:hypothetical protein